MRKKKENDSFTIQDLIDLLGKEKNKQIPIVIHDYGGCLRSPKCVYKDLDENRKKIAVLD